MPRKKHARAPVTAKGPARSGATRARSRGAKEHAEPRSQPAAADREAFTIVGVGASAGGFEAFTALLRSLPPDPHLAVVFVQHLAPQHESALVPLLSTNTNLG